MVIESDKNSALRMRRLHPASLQCCGLSTPNSEPLRAVIKTRLAAGADPKVQMKNGRMLLHLAAHNNENPAVIEALLDQTGQDATLN